MRFVHNAAVVAALGAASVSWSCNGRGLAAGAPVGQVPQAAVPPSGPRTSGLLDAVSQLPLDGGPAQAMTIRLINDARSAIDTWTRWEKGRTPAA
jgi:hypothetical protein